MNSQKTNSNLFRSKTLLLARACIFLNIFIFCFLKNSNANPNSTSTIKIGGKVFTEQNILVDLISIYLKDKGYNVTSNKNLGGTFVAYEALKNGNLDLYVEYSGTAYHSIFKQNTILNSSETFNWLKEKFRQNDIYLFKSLGFINSYALIAPQRTKFNKISDLKNESPKLRIGFEHELLSRPDGYANLIKKYDLKFKNPKSMNVGLMYEALHNNQLDIGIGYTTDGRNKAYNIKILEDDLNFFPQYQAVILSRLNTLNKFENLKSDLDQLTGQISNQEMTDMNYSVDALKLPSENVARDFLIRKGIIQAKNEKTSSKFLGLKNSEYQLVKIKFIEHIKICAIALFISIIVSFILGILAFEIKPLKNIIFIFVNLFQTIPSLALLGFLIPLMGIGFKPALVALTLYSILPLVHNIFIGLNEVEADIIESCKAIGMTDFQILTKVRIPMAMPTIGAGLRTSTVIIISMATVAAFIGAGGLGELIFQGISSLNHRMIFLGAVPAALLALIADFIVLKISLYLTSEGLKKNKG